MHLLLKLPLFATCFLTAWATPASSAAHQLSSRSPPTDPSGYPVDFWEKGDRARYRKNAPRFPFRKPRTEAYEEDQSTVDEADEAIRDCWATWVRSPCGLITWIISLAGSIQLDQRSRLGLPGQQML